MDCHYLDACESKIQKIIHLQSLVKKMTKSQVSTANAPIKFDVLVGHDNIKKQVLDTHEA